MTVFFSTCFLPGLVWRRSRPRPRSARILPSFFVALWASSPSAPLAIFLRPLPPFFFFLFFFYFLYLSLSLPRSPSFSLFVSPSLLLLSPPVVATRCGRNFPARRPRPQKGSKSEGSRTQKVWIKQDIQCPSFPGLSRRSEEAQRLFSRRISLGALSYTGSL